MSEILKNREVCDTGEMMVEAGTEVEQRWNAARDRSRHGELKSRVGANSSDSLKLVATMPRGQCFWSLGMCNVAKGRLIPMTGIIDVFSLKWPPAYYAPIGLGTSRGSTHQNQHLGRSPLLV